MTSLLARTALVVGLALGGGLSCKLTLTPEGLLDTYHAIKDARKDLTPENEYYVGRSVATNVLARGGYKYLDADGFASRQLHPATAYVNALGNYLAVMALEIGTDDDRPSPIAGWHFVILDDETINAFAAPGGFIFVTKGAVELADNEDELAAVLAHEVAHVRLGHALGSIKKSRLAGVGKEFLDKSVQLNAAQLGELSKIFDGAMKDMIDSLMVKGYARDTELAADKLGLQIMVHAGYDPKAFVVFLDKLRKHQDTGTGGMSSTHPKAEDRIAKLQAQMKGMPAVTITQARTDRFVAARAAM